MKSYIRLASLAILLAWTALAQAEPPSDHRLDQGWAPEERARLQRELDEYSNQAYPDHQSLQQRRQEMRQRLRQRLEQADEDGDGTISRAEAERHLPWLARNFDRIDSNGDGVISQEELRAAREKRREMREDRSRP